MNIEKLLKEAYLNGFEDAQITDKVKGLKFDYNGMAEHYAQTKVKNLDIPRVSEAKRKLPMAISVHRAAKLMSYENFASWYNERFGNSR